MPVGGGGQALGNLYRPYEEPSDEGAVTVKLWIYVMAGGAIAAYIASIAAKSMFAPLS